MDKGLIANYIDGKSFKDRVRETWDNFKSNASKIEDLISKDAPVEEIVSITVEALKPAFNDVTFRVEEDKENKKMRLYLSPNGITPFALEQIYFKKQAPKALLNKWEFKIGLPKVNEDKSIEKDKLAPNNLKYKIEFNQNDVMNIKVYVENKQNSDFSIIWNEVANNLREVLGEVHYIEFLQGFELLADDIEDDQVFNYEELIDFLVLSSGGEDIWQETDSLEKVILQMREYNRVKQDAIPGDTEILRESVNSVLTCMPAFEAMYLQDEPFLLEVFRKKGIVPGFLVIELKEGVEQVAILPTMMKIAKDPYTDTYMQIGLAKGERLYLDFVVWDIENFLNELEEKLKNIDTVKTAYFQPFNCNLTAVCLKKSN